MEDQKLVGHNLLIGIGIEDGLKIHAERRQSGRRWQIPPGLVPVGIHNRVKSWGVYVRREGMPVPGLRHALVMRRKSLFREYRAAPGFPGTLCHFLLLLVIR
jgi:hypothetical protein